MFLMTQICVVKQINYLNTKLYYRAQDVPLWIRYAYASLVQHAPVIYMILSIS